MAPVAVAGPTYQLHLLDVGGSEQIEVDRDRDGVCDCGDYRILRDEVVFVDGSPVSGPRLFSGFMYGRLTALGGSSARAGVSVVLPAGSIAVNGVFDIDGNGFIASAFGKSGSFTGMRGTVDVVFNNGTGPDLYITLR